MKELVVIGVGVVLIVAAVQEARVARAQRDIARAEQRAEVHQIAAESWQATADQLRGDLEQCTTQWARAKNTADQQLEQAMAAKAAAEQQAEQWKARWASRPQGCNAALAALDTACPALEGY